LNIGLLILFGNFPKYPQLLSSIAEPAVRLPKMEEFPNRPNAPTLLTATSTVPAHTYEPPLATLYV
jgi:hypothetical protein